MNKWIIKLALNHPHKISAMEYFFRKTSLLFIASKKLLKIHFLNTCKKILGLNFIKNLQKYQSDIFLENKFCDPIVSVQLLPYLIVKKIKPQTAVKTGVARGETTASILRAMNENNKGHLYSIDLPVHKAITEKIDQKGTIKYILKDKQ